MRNGRSSVALSQPRTMTDATMRDLPEAHATLLRERLRRLYADGTKHAVYQNVPEFVAQALGYTEQINADWRSDSPRLKYLEERIVPGPAFRVADVGANTGYFALNLARRWPHATVTAFEPNANHRQFVREIVDAFELTNVHVDGQTWDLAFLNRAPTSDLVLHLNILHHAGVDFDQQLAGDLAGFSRYAREYLVTLRGITRSLCFQLGSNHGGQKTRPIVQWDDDARRLQWNVTLLRDTGWKITHVGLPTRSGQIIEYQDVPAEVVENAANGSLDAVLQYFTARPNPFPGEFHRRPLLVCHSA